VSFVSVDFDFYSNIRFFFGWYSADKNSAANSDIRRRLGGLITTRTATGGFLTNVQFAFRFYCATLCYRGICCRCVSVSPSGIVSERLNIESCKWRYTVPQKLATRHKLFLHYHLRHAVKNGQNSDSLWNSRPSFLAPTSSSWPRLLTPPRCSPPTKGQWFDQSNVPLVAHVRVKG